MPESELWDRKGSLRGNVRSTRLLVQQGEQDREIVCHKAPLVNCYVGNCSFSTNERIQCLCMKDRQFKQGKCARKCTCSERAFSTRGENAAVLRKAPTT